MQLGSFSLYRAPLIVIFGVFILLLLLAESNFALPLLADDGDGLVTIAPSNVEVGAVTDFSIVYTVDEAGGIRDGGLQISIPDGFSTPTVSVGATGSVAASVTSGVGVLGAVFDDADTPADWSESAALLEINPASVHVSGGAAIQAAVLGVGLGTADITYDISVNHGGNEDWSEYTTVSFWAREVIALVGNTVEFYIEDSVNGIFTYTLNDMSTAYEYNIVDISADAALLGDVVAVGFRLPLGVVTSYEFDNLVVGPIATDDTQYDQIQISDREIALQFLSLENDAEVTVTYEDAVATSTPGTYTFATTQRVDSTSNSGGDGAGIFTAVTSSPAVTVTAPAVASVLQLTTLAGASTTSLVVGSSTEIVITARTASGTIDTAFAGAVPLVFSGLSNSPLGTSPVIAGVHIGTTATVTFAGGVATTSVLAVRAETASLDVTNGSIGSLLDAADDLDVVVSAGVATSSTSVISVSPTSATTTEPVTISITTKDTEANEVTIGGETVVVQVVGANATTVPATDNGDGTYVGVYVPTATGTDTITVTLNGDTVTNDSDGVNDGNTTIVVTEGVSETPAVSHLTLTAGGARATTSVAGAVVLVAVTAVNASGTTAVDFTGSKTLTFSGLSTAADGTAPTAAGAVVGSAVAVTFVAGVAEDIEVVGVKAETSSLEVSDGSISTTADPDHDLDMTTLAASPAQLIFGTTPTVATTTESLSPAPVIQSVDQFLNPATTAVTVTLESPTSALSGTTTIDVTGTGSYPGVSFVTTGEHVLVATASGVTTATSSSISTASSSESSGSGGNTETTDSTEENNSSGGGGGGSSRQPSGDSSNDVAAQGNCGSVLIGDLNDDCVVDIKDFSVVAFWYQRPIDDLVAQQREATRSNGDGVMDFKDFSVLSFYYRPNT